MAENDKLMFIDANFRLRGDKWVRTQSICGRMALDGLYVLQNAEWLSALRSELLSFNAGKHDNIVDALGLIGQLLDTITSGNEPVVQPEKRTDSGYWPYEPPGRPNDWVAW